jgi:hypothetical protein
VESLETDDATAASVTSSELPTKEKRKPKTQGPSVSPKVERKNMLKMGDWENVEVGL